MQFYAAQVVHGLSVPLGKVGYHIPRTISTALSSASAEPEPIRLPSNYTTHSTATPQSSRGLRYYRNRIAAQQARGGKKDGNDRSEPPRITFQISKPQQQDEEGQQQDDQEEEVQQQNHDPTASAESAPRQTGMPAAPAPLTVHEPRRPIRLLGDDGRVTETLNAESE